MVRDLLSPQELVMTKNKLTSITITLCAAVILLMAIPPTVSGSDISATGIPFDRTLPQTRTTLPERITILTWNLGNPDAKDSGRFPATGMVKPGAFGTGISEILEESNVDIMLLQETSLEFSSRLFRRFRTKPSASFSYNARNISTINPDNSFNAGKSTISRFEPVSVTRIELPGKAPFPFNLITYDRFLLETRYRLDNRDLVLLNTHIAFFDVREKRRKEQLAFIKERILSEHKKGNLVVVGGDWNLILPGVDREDFAPYTTPRRITRFINIFHEGWTPEGWTWAYPRKTATISVPDRKGYREGETFSTIIDGFLVSPGLTVVNTRGIDMGFSLSDHQPVIMEITIDNYEDPGLVTMIQH
jgi:endonuclease/exonuclease/phosphatase family metal-dependent hydrolase